MEKQGLPGTQSKTIQRDSCGHSAPSMPTDSQLSQWPVQIKLAPVKASYFDNSRLLIAADCTAYAYGSFHNEFIRSHITLIGCPKLDNCDYADKLTAILAENDIKSVTVVKNALQAGGKFIPWRVVTISTDGRILD